MLLRLRVTQSLSPHSTPSPDLTPLRQPSRPLCAADKSKGHPYMHSVLSHMLSPQPWQRSLPMQRAAVNTETPNWRVLRTTECPAWGEASPSSPSRLSGHHEEETGRTWEPEDRNECFGPTRCGPCALWLVRYPVVFSWDVRLARGGKSLPML